MKCLYKNYCGLHGQGLSMVEPTVKNMLQYDIEIQKKADDTVDLFTNTVHIFKCLSEAPPGVNRSIKVYCPILSTLRWSLILGHVVMTSKDAIWLELGSPIHQVHVHTFEVMSCVHIDVVKVMRRVLLRTDGSEIPAYLNIHPIFNEWGHPVLCLFIVIVLFIIVHVG